MEEVTFWRSWDPSWKNVIVGYEVKYEETIGGQKPYYKHILFGGKDNYIANTFKFEKGEYIISIRGESTLKIKNIEFQTNKMRYFNASGTQITLNLPLNAKC